MKSFIVNGYIWKVQYVEPTSEYLIDRTGNLTVATTDPETLTIYISDNLYGNFKTRVVLHEIGHVIMFSYGYVGMIHEMCYPSYWIEAEEAICNFLADRGREALDYAYEILGDEIIPYYIKK